MKNRFFLLVIFLLNFSGLGNDLQICPTCPDSMPDTIKMQEIVESIGKPMIDSFTKKVKDEVYETKQKQDSAAKIVDSVYNEKFKKSIIGRVDHWPLLSGRMYYKYWLFWIYPNGDSLYYDTYDKIK